MTTHRAREEEAEGVERLLGQLADARFSPDADQLARGRAAVLAAHSAAGPSPTPGVWRGRLLLRGWPLAVASAVLLIASGSLVAAESGPGQPFYGLRLSIGALTEPREEPAHDRWLASRLDERLTEVRAAARDGDGHGARAAIDAYLRTLAELSLDGITDPAIVTLLERHEGTLTELLSTAPGQSTGGLRDALDAANKVSTLQPPAESAAPRPTPPAGGGASPPGSRP
jgi:hypothetical protein